MESLKPPQPSQPARSSASFDDIRALLAKGEFAQAHSRAKERLEPLEGAEDSVALATGLGLVAEAERGLGELVAAVSTGTRGAGVARRLEAPGLVGRCLCVVGAALTQLGEHSEALSTLHGARDLIAGTDAALESEILRWSAWSCVMLGRHAEATLLAERSAAAAREDGDDVGLAHSLCAAGAAMLEAAKADEAGATVAAAEERFTLAAEAAQRGGSVSAHNLARGNLAIAALEAGRLDEAAAVFGDLLEWFDRAGDEQAAIESVAQLARLRRQQGDLREATALLEECCRRSEAAGDNANLRSAHADLADLHAAAEDYKCAYEHLAEARRLDEALARAEAGRAGQLLAVRVAVEESQQELVRLRDHTSGLEDLVAALNQERNDLAAESLLDPLTGLANRRAADRGVAAAIASNRHCGAVLLDIDHFKAVNDTFGHATGDAVLQRVAGAIAATLRDSDLAVRYGGEEFLCLLLSDSQEAPAVAERIRHAVAGLEMGDLAPGLDGVTVSAGVTEGPAHDLHALIARADQRLYAAKRGGRNRVVAE